MLKINIWHKSSAHSAGDWVKQRWSVGGQRESARNSLSSAVASSTDRSISKPSRSRAWQHRPRPLRLPSRSA